MVLFQSTLPRRERLRPTGIYGKISYFNPRSREGSDELDILCMLGLVYFNPRSREGSDKLKSCRSSSMISFQSTLPRRERRRFILKIPFTDCISIHAPAKGATRFATVTCRGIDDFNPRSREGSDYKTKADKAEELQFQSTLPRRERRSSTDNE